MPIYENTKLKGQKSEAKLEREREKERERERGRETDREVNAAFKINPRR